MELNTKGRYAVMAMADLAKYGADGAQSLPAIAERQQMSLAYLEQLFLKLRRAGLVESARGRSGGYRLGRPASEITVAEIMAAVEEDTRMTRCSGEVDKPCIGAALPDARAVGRAGRPDRGVPRGRDAAGGDRRHPAGQARHARRRHTVGPDRGMNAGRTYLDWNATAPLRPEARAASWPRSISSAIRPRCTPRGAARAPSSRMRARASRARRRQAVRGGLHQRRHRGE